MSKDWLADYQLHCMILGLDKKKKKKEKKESIIFYV